MTDRLEPPLPGVDLPAERAADLAADLARAVLTRLGSSADDVGALASAMSLDPARVRGELAYLLVLITRFCIDVGVAEPGASPRLAAAFEAAVLSADTLGLTPRGLRVRRREYRDALSNPHPEFGRAYSVGRVFARYCDASHEVAVIEFAARTYMDQLPPMLGRLRSVRVV